MKEFDDVNEDRAFWLQGECPAWCDGRHGEEDYRVDRCHHADWYFELHSALGEGDRYQDGEGNVHFYPTSIEMGIRQHVEWAAPVVEIAITPGSLSKGLDLSCNEAERLGKALLEACDIMNGQVESLAEQDSPTALDQRGAVWYGSRRS